MDRMRVRASSPHEPGFFHDDLGHLRCDGADGGRNKESATRIWSEAVVTLHGIIRQIRKAVMKQLRTPRGSGLSELSPWSHPEILGRTQILHDAAVHPLPTSRRCQNSMSAIA